MTCIKKYGNERFVRVGHDACFFLFCFPSYFEARTTRFPDAAQNNKTGSVKALLWAWEEAGFLFISHLWMRYGHCTPK